MVGPVKYNSFDVETVKLEDLDLDPDNVRIPSVPDFIEEKGEQSALIEYLYHKEGADRLVDSFLEDGYTDIEYPVVLKYKKGRFLVLEGNRRVSALKVIANPDLAGEAAQAVRDKIEKAQVTEPIRRIYVKVTPTRSAFETTLARLHTQKSKKSWPRDQIAQFYYSKIVNEDAMTLKDLKNKFPLHAAKIDRFVQIRSLRDHIRSTDFEHYGYPQLRSEISYFPYTPFEYAYNRVASLLDIHFDIQRGLVIDVDEQQTRGLLAIAHLVCTKQFTTRTPKEYDLAGFVESAMNPDKTSDTPVSQDDDESDDPQNTDEHQPDDSNADSSGAQEEPDSTDSAKESPASSHPDRNARRPFLEVKTLRQTSNYKQLNENIRFRIEELNSLNRAKQPFAAILLSRNILELFLLDYASLCGVQLRRPEHLESNLKDIKYWLTRTKKTLIDSQKISEKNFTNLIGGISQLLAKPSQDSTENEFASSIYLMHGITHNLSVQVEGSDVLYAWNKIKSVMKRLLPLI